MKLCPKCKAVLDDNARFCLYCMTSLEEKEQIQPPIRQVRRWPLVLLPPLLLGTLLIANMILDKEPPAGLTESPSIVETSAAIGTTEDLLSVPETVSQTVDGVCYTFRPATSEDHPTAVVLGNHYVLIQVEGPPPDGIYRIPSFVGNDTNALVSVVADGAFVGTNARAIDLGHNVRYVWGNAFGGYPLTDLYLHEDVLIDRVSFSGCTKNLTIHCPGYLENTEGLLWSDLAADYGFRWQETLI